MERPEVGMESSNTGVLNLFKMETHLVKQKNPET